MSNSLVAGYWFKLPYSRRLRPILMYDTYQNAGVATTLSMAGLDWWPLSHLRLQTGYTRDISSNRNIFQVMASVSY